MRPTIVIYGSSTGTCQSLAQRIADKLGVETLDAANLTESIISSHDNLIIGTSTWGAGDMQDDWYDAVKTLQNSNLTGKTIALFGCGDSASFPDTFVSGMGELYDALKDSGATFVGAVPADGYPYDDSTAVADGKFVGLALDEVNEADKTDERIAAWIAEIQPCL